MQVRGVSVSGSFLSVLPEADQVHEKDGEVGQCAVRARMVLRIPRPRLRFRPPVTPPAVCPQKDPERRRDAAPFSPVPLHLVHDFSEWVRVLRLDGAGVRWKGRALLFRDTACTAILHLEGRLPVYDTAAVRDALLSLDHMLLPVLCLAVGVPPASTIFLCKGFRHARALQTAI
eukprot:386403-Rhodomonas_salina.1